MKISILLYIPQWLSITFLKCFFCEDAKEVGVLQWITMKLIFSSCFLCILKSIDRSWLISFLRSSGKCWDVVADFEKSVCLWSLNKYPISVCIIQSWIIDNLIFKLYLDSTNSSRKIPLFTLSAEIIIHVLCNEVQIN